MHAVYRYIEDLPLVDDPEIFGLHGNADLAFRSLQTKQVLGVILDIQPKEGGGGGGLTREETVLQVVNDLQAKLPPDYRPDDVKTGIKSLGGMGKPLNICLKQEIDRLQKVLPPHTPTYIQLLVLPQPRRHLMHAPPKPKPPPPGRDSWWVHRATAGRAGKIGPPQEPHAFASHLKIHYKPWLEPRR
mgnify:CR=1 FL=1